MPTSKTQATPRRILIIQPHKLGDMLLTTPMLSGLRQSLPDAAIDIWVAAGTEVVLNGNSDVNRTEVRQKKLPHKKILPVAIELRKRRYDTVLMPHGNNGNYTIAAWLAKVPRRIGWCRRWYKRLLTDHTETTGMVHMVDRWLELGSIVAGRPLDRSPIKFSPTLAEEERAQKLMKLHRLRTGHFICMHSGTGGSGLAWGIDHYTELAKAVIAKTSEPVVFVGGPNDVSESELLVQKIGPDAISIAGQTSFGELAAFLRGNRCFVSGSTGTMHVAASQKNPCVLIEPTAPAETRAARWKPWMTESRVLCATVVCPGCELDCDQAKMACKNSIPPGEVLDAIFSLI